MASTTLPAQRFDAHGHPQVDWRQVLTLAGPLMANSAIQALLNLTDTWFIGQVSTQALAGVGAINWLVIMFFGLFGGVGMAVQTIVAQAFGGHRYVRAAQATWTALWASTLSLPLFVLVAISGQWLLQPFALDPAVNQQALAFWQPRMLGAVMGVSLWAVSGFFNGIGRTRITLSINLLTLSLNALLDQVFIFKLHWGIAGAAWATNCATALGLSMAIWIFLSANGLQRYRARLVWRLHMQRLLEQFKLGFPMGAMMAADLFGFALFQLMQAKLSAVDGAASQIVMMLTSIAYMPAIGIALAGTTLVGHAIGAGDKAWAHQLGNFVISMAVTYMGGIGILLALGGPWLMPLFVNTNDALATQVIHTGSQILWLAGAYQLFDGMNLSCSFCLRGAGDAKVPAILLLCLSWFLFVPLTHSLAFAEHQGWVDWLPQFGFGALGGYVAAVIYMGLIGITLALRWRSRAWQRLQIR